MKKTIFIFFLSIICNNLLRSNNNSSSIEFRHITTENGLQHNCIFSIYQDKRGYIWFATENGLHRFDGIHFKIFTHNPYDTNSISDNVVYEIIPGKEDCFYLCTYSGFDLYDPVNEIFRHIPLQLDNNSNLQTKIYIPEAIRDNAGNIYVSAGNIGIFKLNHNTNILEPLSILDSVGQAVQLGNVTNMYIDHENTLWLGSQNRGLFSYNLITKKTKIWSAKNNKNGSVHSLTILSIAQDKWKRLFVGTANGLYYYNYDNSGFKKYISTSSQYSLSYPVIWKMCTDRDNNLWFCTNGSGIDKLTSHNLTFENYRQNILDEKSLSDNFVQCFLEDVQGNYWIGTQRGGVNVYLNTNAKVFKTLKNNPLQPVSLSDISVTAINQDANGKIWIGTDGGGINVYDPIRKNIQYYFKGKPVKKVQGKESILKIFIDKENQIWAGGYLSGLIRISADRNSSKVYMFNPQQNGTISHNDIRWILEDTYNRLWIATNGGGVNLYNRHSDSFRSFTSDDPENPLCSNYTLILLQDSLDNLWVGSYNGISKINLKTFKIRNYGRESNLNALWIYSFLYDHKKQLWVGTNSGLYLYDPKTDKFKDITPSVQLPSKVICGLIEDKYRRIWISTYSGIVLYNPENNKSNLYTKLDGLPSDNFNHGSYFKNEKGEIFFGSISGLVYFNPEEIQTNQFIPPVYITAIFNSNGEEIKISHKEKKRIVLAYKVASAITIDYTALNYIIPEKNHYAIYLEGVDEKWRFVGNQKRIVYTNLSPGKYIFKVKASNNDNVWNEIGDTLEITILPPFWRTTLAYILYIIATISILIYIWYQTLLRVRYKKDLEIEHIKAQKAEEIAQMKTNFFVSISHELSTPLTLITVPIEKIIKLKQYDERLLKMAQKNARKLLSLVNEILEFQKIEEHEKLTLSENDFVLFIRQIVQNFEELAYTKKIKLSFNSPISSLWMAFDASKLEKVFYNLLSNAIKYTSEGGEIFVTLRYFDTNVIIEVKDTGIGISSTDLPNIFNRYYRSKTTTDKHLSSPTGFGIGLFITKRLIELHEGTIEIESELNKGSTFTVKLPCKKLGLQSNIPHLEEVDEKEFNSIENDEFDFDEINKNLKKPAILIIEDNPEVCSLLELLLKSNYQLFFAQNGTTGYRLAIKLLPNLIITDIMLPQMDGVELCKRLKKDFNTRHIPILMLTALNSNEFMLAGLASGADDYVSKPFNPEILLLRIRNLIESRLVLLKRFYSDAHIQPSEIVANNGDVAFLDALVSVIEKNLSNENFSVDELARTVNLTTITLYRKLKSLTGLSINQFVRTIRLKNAAKFLENKDVSVQEAAFRSGFVDLKYFRKCFQKQFGINPSQYSAKFYSGKSH